MRKVNQTCALASSHSLGGGLKLEFLKRLRGEMTWPSAEALKAQIFKDVAKAKRYFRLADGLGFPALEAQNDSER